MNSENQFQFIVNKKQIGKSKTLKASILYKKVEDFTNTSIMHYNSILQLRLIKYDLNIIENAFLKDKLTLKSNVYQLDENFFKLIVIVSKKNKNNICKATFGYAIQKTS